MVQSIRESASAEIDCLVGYAEGMRMHIQSSDLALEAPTTYRHDESVEDDEASSPLTSLLNCSIRLRELYREARRTTCASDLLPLRGMFDGHYKKQVHMIDVLVDKARRMGDAERIFAGTFLQAGKTSGNLRARFSPMVTLRTLLDEHEEILDIALTRNPSVRGDAWFRDLAVGQVVLINQQQCQAICDVLGHLFEDPSMPIPVPRTSD